ncbi:MAG: response regulator transcription factor, partial [Clostridia bacterium]|nr:response regulator transcription factor [Clostridia bacterium]
YNVLEAEDGEKALEVFEMEKEKIKLILLDVMMPKLDGWSVLRQIRQESKVPIVMLTARGEEQDELFGFELGVDEYIAKPFSPKILVARVEAILKRTSFCKKDVKDYGGITIDNEGRTVKVDGKEIPCETTYDLNSNTTAVTILNVSVNNEITVEATAEKLITDNAGAADRFYDILLHSQMDYTVKSGLWYAFKGKNQLLYKVCSQKEYTEILSAAEEMRNLLSSM